MLRYKEDHFEAAKRAELSIFSKFKLDLATDNYAKNGGPGEV